MSYTKIIYHVIFSTYRRERTIFPEKEHDINAYISGSISSKKGFVYSINGMDDHIHIVCDIPPTSSISETLKIIKQSSSKWAKESGFFPRWNGWEQGYSLFTCSYSSLKRVTDYVNNQKNHHHRMTFGEELKCFFDEMKIEYDERYLPR